MSKDIKVVPMEKRSNKDAIQMLENMIERVKSGEIDTVALAYTTKEGSIGGDVSAGSNNFLVWSSITHLERTFYAKTILSGD